MPISVWGRVELTIQFPKNCASQCADTIETSYLCQVCLSVASTDSINDID